MKKVALFMILVLGCTFCFFISSCEKDEGNNAPAIPGNPTPADAALYVSTSVMLSWTCSDPDDGDSLKYDLYFGTVNPPNTLLMSDLNQPNFALIGLDSALTYYWRVTAKDSHGGSSVGSIWRFTTTSSFPTEGLVAYYPFNGNANDESGNGHDGLVNGSSLILDRFGNPNQAYSFDGYDDEIQVPHSESLNLIGDLTISAWFNSTEAPTFRTAHTILAKRSPANYGTFPYLVCINYQYGIPSDYKKPMFCSAKNDSYQFMQSASDVTNNNWNHMVCVISSDNLKIYLNDEVILNTTINNQIRVGNTAPLLIGSGARTDKPAEQFKGYIDDIRIYDRVLTDSELLQLFHEGGWQK